MTTVTVIGFTITFLITDDSNILANKIVYYTMTVFSAINLNSIAQF